MKAKRIIQHLVETGDSTPRKYRDHTVWLNSSRKLHRLDGPAVEWASGSKAWWVDGHYVPVDNEQEFEQWLKEYENQLLGIKI